MLRIVPCLLLSRMHSTVDFVNTMKALHIDVPGKDATDNGVSLPTGTMLFAWN